MPKPISVSSFELIVEQMFEHWQQVAYFDNENSVFPTDELLDSLELYENPNRSVVSKALGDLLVDFNELLVKNDLYDLFYYNGYRRVYVKKNSALFV